MVHSAETLQALVYLGRVGCLAFAFAVQTGQKLRFKGTQHARDASLERRDHVHVLGQGVT